MSENLPPPQPHNPNELELQVYEGEIVDDAAQPTTTDEFPKGIEEGYVVEDHVHTVGPPEQIPPAAEDLGTLAVHPTSELTPLQEKKRKALRPAPILEAPYDFPETPLAPEDIKNFDKLLEDVIESANRRFRMNRNSKIYGHEANGGDEYWNGRPASEKGAELPSLRNELAERLRDALQRHPQLRTRLDAKLAKEYDELPRLREWADETSGRHMTIEGYKDAAAEALTRKDELREPEITEYRYLGVMKYREAGPIASVRKFFIGETTPTSYRRAVGRSYEKYRGGRYIDNKERNYVMQGIDAAEAERLADQASSGLRQAWMRIRSIEDVIDLADDMATQDALGATEEALGHFEKADALEDTLYDELFRTGSISAETSDSATDTINSMGDGIHAIDLLITSPDTPEGAKRNLATIRARQMAEYIETRYRYEQTAIASKLGIAHYHTEGRGIYSEDGSGTIIYPDKSYGFFRPGALVEDRRWYDGEPWQPTGAEVNDLEDTYLDQADFEQLLVDYRTSFRSWFHDQSDPTSARHTQQLADELLNRLLDQAEPINDPARRQEKQKLLTQAHTLAYWGTYLHADAKIGHDGHVVEDYTYHGIDGTWAIYPDGSMWLQEIDKDGSPQWTRHYDPRGNILSD